MTARLFIDVHPTGDDRYCRCCQAFIVCCPSVSFPMRKRRLACKVEAKKPFTSCLESGALRSISCAMAVGLDHKYKKFKAHLGGFDTLINLGVPASAMADSEPCVLKARHLCSLLTEGSSGNEIQRLVNAVRTDFLHTYSTNSQPCLTSGPRSWTHIEPKGDTITLFSP